MVQSNARLHMRICLYIRIYNIMYIERPVKTVTTLNLNKSLKLKFYPAIKVYST